MLSSRILYQQPVHCKSVQRVAKKEGVSNSPSFCMSMISKFPKYPYKPNLFLKSHDFFIDIEVCVNEDKNHKYCMLTYF